MKDIEEDKNPQEVSRLKFRDIINPFSSITYGLRNLKNYQDPPYDKLWRTGFLAIYNLIAIKGLSQGLQKLIENIN